MSKKGVFKSLPHLSTEERFKLVGELALSEKQTRLAANPARERRREKARLASAAQYSSQRHKQEGLQVLETLRASGAQVDAEAFMREWVSKGVKTAKSVAVRGRKGRASRLSDYVVTCDTCARELPPNAYVDSSPKRCRECCSVLGKRRRMVAKCVTSWVNACHAPTKAQVTVARQGFREAAALAHPLPGSVVRG